MKKILLLLSLLLVLPVYAWAGDESLQKIEIKKTAWGNRYYYQEKTLTTGQLEEQLRKVPATEPEIKKAKRLLVASVIFGGAGGYLVGYQIGTAAGGGDLKWDQAGYGVVSVVAGVFCSKKADKHYEKAVEIYNAHVEQAANPGPSPDTNAETGNDT